MPDSVAYRPQVFEAVAAGRVTRYCTGTWYLDGAPVTDPLWLAAVIDLYEVPEFRLRSTGHGWWRVELTPTDALRTATMTLGDLGPEAVDDAVRHAVAQKEKIIASLLASIRAGDGSTVRERYLPAGVRLAQRDPGNGRLTAAAKTAGLTTMLPARSRCTVRITHHRAIDAYSVAIVDGDRPLWLIAYAVTGWDFAEELACSYAQREGIGVSRIDIE